MYYYWVEIYVVTEGPCLTEYDQAEQHNTYKAMEVASSCEERNDPVDNHHHRSGILISFLFFT